MPRALDQPVKTARRRIGCDNDFGVANEARNALNDAPRHGPLQQYPSSMRNCAPCVEHDERSLAIEETAGVQIQGRTPVRARVYVDEHLRGGSPSARAGDPRR